MVPLPLVSFSDPQTGRVRIRLVNIESSSYRVAREYMIRLDRDDLEDPDKLRPIAEAAGLTRHAFRDRYGYLAESGAPAAELPDPACRLDVRPALAVAWR
jgi:6-phosphofructokinase 1